MTPRRFTSQLTHPDERDATTAATGFAEWYATNENQQVRDVTDHGTVPTASEAVALDELPATTAGFVRSAADGRLEPPRPVTRALYPPLQEAVESVLAGERSAETALEEAASRIELPPESG